MNGWGGTAANTIRRSVASVPCSIVSRTDVYPAALTSTSYPPGSKVIPARYGSSMFVTRTRAPLGSVRTVNGWGGRAANTIRRSVASVPCSIVSRAAVYPAALTSTSYAPGPKAIPARYGSSMFMTRTRAPLGSAITVNGWGDVC